MEISGGLGPTAGKVSIRNQYKCRHHPNFILNFHARLFKLCFFSFYTKIRISLPKRIEYILEGKLLEKSVKRPFYCSVFILRVYFTYLGYITFWALEHHFIENLKLMLKETQIMK